MDSPKLGKGGGNRKGGLIWKTWERCKSLRTTSSSSGCFSIYVGPEKERFVMKTEYVNHPLFKILLEEAESEYGYTTHGPLMLPCQVHHFIKVLMDMADHHHQGRCNFARPRTRTRSTTPPNYHLLITPPRLIIP